MLGIKMVIIPLKYLIIHLTYKMKQIYSPHLNLIKKKGAFFFHDLIE